MTAEVSDNLQIAASVPAQARADVFPGKRLWWAVGAATLVDLVWLTASDRLSFALAPALLVIAAVVLAMIIGLRPSTIKPLIRDAAIGSAFIMTSFCALKVLDYLLMSLRFPLGDDLLDSWDRALGLHWLAYAQTIAAHDWAVTLLRTAYLSLTQLTVAVFVVLFYFRGAARAAQYVRHFFGCAAIATVVGALFPCIGVMVRYASPELAATFGPGAGTYYLPPLEALRSGMPYQLDLRNMPGLVEFPSFHTSSAVLVAYAFRDFKRMSWLASLYALILIASTPLMGGHYFVDLIAGTAVAVAVIAVDHANSRRTRNAPLQQPAASAPLAL